MFVSDIYLEKKMNTVNSGGISVINLSWWKLQDAKCFYILRQQTHYTKKYAPAPPPGPFTPRGPLTIDLGSLTVDS